MSISRIFEEVRLWFPGRITLGRLGMRLTKIGEALQRRYAGWNHKFRMEMELTPDQSPDFVFHVSVRIIKESILSFGDFNSQRDKRLPFVEELLQIQGVKKIWITPYEVGIEKARVFSIEEVAPKVEAVLLKYLPNAA